jgi:acyl carrier protein
MSKLRESQKQEIKEMISDKLFIDLELVQDDSIFVNDLGADSLDEVEFIMEVEKMFDISIPDEVAEEVHTVNQLFEVVERYIPETC